MRIDAPALAERLRRAAMAYYDTDQLEMTDTEYDSGIEQLRIAVAEDPALAPSYADLLEKVAAGQSGGGDVVHPTMMGSLDKAKTLDEVDAFVRSVGGPVVVEPKLDGLAIRAIYTNGRLALVARRGDGLTGENITGKALALAITGLPRRLVRGAEHTPDGRHDDLSVEVRGEVFMPTASFPLAQKVRASLKADPFKNERQAAAGILARGDSAYCGLLAFACYDVRSVAPDGGPVDLGSYQARLVRVDEAGIDTAQSLLLRFVDEDNDSAVFDDEWLWSREVDIYGNRKNLPTTEYVRNVIDRIAEYRDRLGFPIDGAVIKATDPADRRRLGEGSRAPKWAIAYKYDAETATTRVTDITTTVGKTGRMGIRIEVAPVFVSGTTITYATGHNVAWMAEKDVRVGDTVLVKRANDVIPYIESVVLADRPADSKPWTPPSTDPNGGDWDKSTLLWRSTDPSLSVGALIRYAASRDALDIEGIGTEIVEALVEQGFVGDVADLFGLPDHILAALPLGENRTLGAKNAAKIAAEIDKARTAPWNRVITALGMRMTGRTMSRRLAAAFPTLPTLLAATTDDLAAVDGIGDVKAQVIHGEIARNRPVLAKLAVLGVKAADERAQAAASTGAGALAGMTVVVSGSVPGYSRTTVAELIDSLGGKASSSVSANTSLLVSEPSTSSKYLTATKLGVRIVTPAEFLAMIR